MKKEDAKSMTERAQKCEENAQRVSDPFLREAYARFGLVLEKEGPSHGAA